ncbi:MAG: two-component regulator propeller domain-containing protein [Bryobacteraceae bacterium]
MRPGEEVGNLSQALYPQPAGRILGEISSANNSLWTSVVPRLTCQDFRGKTFALFVLLFLNLSFCAASAETGTHSDHEYLIDTWKTDRGLPDDLVTSIEQTPDGYLWIATINGLARFNGVEFTIVDRRNTPSLPDSRVINIFLDRRNRLWRLPGTPLKVSDSRPS